MYKNIYYIHMFVFRKSEQRSNCWIVKPFVSLCVLSLCGEV